MALPKIDSPIYKTTLPLSKKVVTFRPFLVKEQKILMMALESQESDTIEMTIKQIVNNCNLSTDLDIDTLPLLDLEYFFYQLRARSIGELIELKYRCQNKIDDNVCNNVMDASLNLLELELENSQLSDIIKLTDNIGVKLKYPNLSTIKSINDENNSNSTESFFKMLAQCIEYIYDEDSVYYSNETPLEEIIQFVESLNKKQLDDIISFINNLPSLKKNVNVICNKCGFEHNIEIEGMESFFD